MEIKTYKQRDETQILKLFKLVFKKEMNPQYWRWRFQDNPAGKHLIKLMWDEDNLIGHYAVSPVRSIIDGEGALTALSMTTMTHPQYSGLGIFGSLANSLYDNMESEYRVHSVWGFPNNNSHRGFIKNLKWKDLLTIPHLIKDVSKVEKKLSKSISNTKTFEEAHSNLINEFLGDNYRIYSERNSDYLNWRYTKNPTVNYDIFEFNDSDLNGFLVVKAYQPADRKNKQLFIMECGLSLSKMGLLNDFISHMLSYYNFNIDSVHIWLPIWDKRFGSFEKQGFEIGGKQTYLGVRPSDKYANVMSDPRNWFYSYGDSDVY